MNRWGCDRHGCTSTAVGVGGAIGLRAIGWFFAPGPQVFCPLHRPDATSARVPSHDREEDRGEPCSQCTAELAAAHWQLNMGGRDWPAPERAVDTADRT